jgi:hypothetical protein
MPGIKDLKVGDRIRIVAEITNPGNEAIPTETGLPIGTEGTVRDLRITVGQVSVSWDNGCRLMLLDAVDDGKYEVLS